MTNQGFHSKLGVGWTDDDCDLVGRIYALLSTNSKFPTSSYAPPPTPRPPSPADDDIWHTKLVSLFGF